MACDILPRIDKQICLFERWLITRSRYATGDHTRTGDS
jgi:hypothetical protein